TLNQEINKLINGGHHLSDRVNFPMLARHSSQAILRGQHQVFARWCRQEQGAFFPCRLSGCLQAQQLPTPVWWCHSFDALRVSFLQSTAPCNSRGCHVEATKLRGVL